MKFLIVKLFPFSILIPLGYMPFPPQCSNFRHLDYVRQTVQISKFFIVKLFPFPILIPLGYMPCLPQSSNFKHLDYVRQTVQISKFLIVKPSPPTLSSLLGADS